MKITKFEEKPAEPTNNLASMGIYIFKWETLRDYLINGCKITLIPHMILEKISSRNFCRIKRNLVAFPFKGYWKDVGTVKSLWEANMDLLDEECELDLFDYDWRIYSVNPNQMPQYLSPGCRGKGIISK